MDRMAAEQISCYSCYSSHPEAIDNLGQQRALPALFMKLNCHDCQAEVMQLLQAECTGKAEEPPSCMNGRVLHAVSLIGIARL